MVIDDHYYGDRWLRAHLLLSGSLPFPMTAAWRSDYCHIRRSLTVPCCCHFDGWCCWHIIFLLPRRVGIFDYPSGFLLFQAKYLLACFIDLPLLLSCFRWFGRHAHNLGRDLPRYLHVITPINIHTIYFFWFELPCP
jgi:hypothetical protein